MEAEMQFLADVFSPGSGYTSIRFWKGAPNGSALVKIRRVIILIKRESSLNEEITIFSSRRKEVNMSNQPKKIEQQTQASEELRQRILAQLEDSKQSIEELSDQELEAISGGNFFKTLEKGFTSVVDASQGTGLSGMSGSKTGGDVLSKVVKLGRLIKI
jgi:bacteriocin-like protein